MIKFNLFKKITISINSFESDRRIVINLIDGKISLEFKENVQENIDFFKRIWIELNKGNVDSFFKNYYAKV